MKVLVTGGTGFIGSAVIRALTHHGHSSLALVRDTAKARVCESASVSIAVGDMWHPETYEPLVAKVEAVVHAAQQKPPGRWSRRAIADMHASDVLMTRTLAKACALQSKTFLYTSGALTHGGYGNGWIDESQAPRPVLLARGHAEMEAELKELQRSRGLRAMIISPGFVYGAGGLFQTMAEMLSQRQYRIIGNGQNYWSLVHVDDVAQAYVLALERGRPGATYFLGDENPMRRCDVIYALADAVESPRPGHVPRWIIGLWLGFPLVEAVTASLRVRNDKAKTELGWQPRFASLSDGMKEVAKALQSSN